MSTRRKLNNSNGVYHKRKKTIREQRYDRSSLNSETKLKVFTAFVVAVIFGLVSFFYFAVTTIY